MSRPLFAALLLCLAGAAAPHHHLSRCDDGYRVHRGDTLYRLARHCGTSVAAIARASHIRNPNRIEIGQRLYFPDSRGPALAARARPAPAPRPQVAAAPRSSEPGVYRFARADTIYSLARWSRTSVPALLAANPGLDPRQIEIGDPVRLPAGAVRPELARARERGAADMPVPVPGLGPRSADPPRAREAPPARAPEPRPPRERPREPEVEAM